MARTCQACGCTSAAGAHVHDMRAALADGDLDRAIDLGLLTAQPCAGCTAACTGTLLASRGARLAALAARERHRARQQRLERRAILRDAARAAPASVVEAKGAATAAPSLPAAAAAALARARERAAGRRAT